MAKTEYITVSMDDGRTVDFPTKRRMLKEVLAYDGNAVRVRMDYVNGETRTFTLPGALLAQAAGHGFSQKLGDEAAGVENLDDAIQAIDELMARLEGGDWNAERESGGLSGASFLAKALIEVTGKSRSEVAEYLSKLTAAQKRALSEKHAQVSVVVARLKAERDAKKPQEDTDALLAGLVG